MCRGGSRCSRPRRSLAVSRREDVHLLSGMIWQQPLASHGRRAVSTYATPTRGCSSRRVSRAAPAGRKTSCSGAQGGADPGAFTGLSGPGRRRGIERSGQRAVAADHAGRAARGERWHPAGLRNGAGRGAGMAIRCRRRHPTSPPEAMEAVMGLMDIFRRGKGQEQIPEVSETRSTGTGYTSQIMAARASYIAGGSDVGELTSGRTALHQFVGGGLVRRGHHRHRPAGPATLWRLWRVLWR